MFIGFGEIMERKFLSSPYIAVKMGNTLSYGGSQLWSDDKTVSGFGCGLIAAADLLLYISGTEVISDKEYMDFVRSIKKYFPIMPGQGIDGIRLSIGLNLCFGHFSMDRLCYWGISGNKYLGRIYDMIKKDTPVILSVGQNIPILQKKEKLSFYRKTGDRILVPKAHASGHYVTVTGIGHKYLRISSWGKKYYIKISEYEDYVSRCSTWMFSNVCVVNPL